MKISLVVPFIDTPEITRHCIQRIIDNTTEPIELIMLDNGSDDNYREEYKKLTNNGMIEYKYVKNKYNHGVLSTFKQGLKHSTGDVICFIHSDVLIQEKAWSIKVREAFEQNPQLGLAGLFGAVGVANNGGRVRSQSNILGLEWGKVEGVDFAWRHHSENVTGLSPATILDGVGMFFSRRALEDLATTDMFDDWRAPHHFYDRIIPLKLIDKGYKIATLGIGFDHWSGATANQSTKYTEFAHRWLLEHNIPMSDAMDHSIYLEAERQFFNEFGNRLPCSVDSNWNYIWGGIR